MKVNQISINNNKFKIQDVQSKTNNIQQIPNIEKDSGFKSIYADKKNNVSFGEIVIGATAVAIAVLVGATAAALGTLFGVSYAVKRISEWRDNKRIKKQNKVNMAMLNDKAMIAAQNPYLSNRKINKIYNGKLKRVLLKDDKAGLNKVIGSNILKYGLATNVLIPLCQVIDGNTSHHKAVPNGINFFGPRGTGKSYIARALGEHYEKEGGYFEEIKLSSNKTQEKLMNEITNIFETAQDNYEDSDETRYTMVMLDEAEKLNELPQEITDKLVSLTENCKDKGVIFVTTSNNLDKVPEKLMQNGRTDMRIPVGAIEDFELADIINFYMKKEEIPHNKIDYEDVLDSIGTEKAEYKPRDIQKALNKSYAMISTAGGAMTSEAVELALEYADVEFDEIEQHEFDKNKATAEKLGGVTDFAKNVDEKIIKIIKDTDKDFDDDDLNIELEKVKQNYTTLKEHWSDIMSGDDYNTIPPEHLHWYFD